MLTNADIITVYLNAVVEGLKKEATDKNQKIPVSSFRLEVLQDSANLYVADYFKYIVDGRGPGKAPPPDKMLEFVQKNPDILAEARKTYTDITEKSLAFIIGRKIAREGTDVFTGKKPKIDLQVAIDAPMEDFMKMIAYYQALSVVNKIQKVS